MTSWTQPPTLQLISATDVEAVVHEVLDGLVGEFSGSTVEAAETVGVSVSAAIEILGDPSLTLTMAAAFDTMYAIAVGWFGDDLGADISAAIEDAALELCNVVGGALKTLLDGDYTLGIPATTDVVDSTGGTGVVVQSLLGDVSVRLVGRG